METLETYTLILKHEFEVPGGDKSEIEPPLVVKYANPFYRTLQNHPSSVIVNEMLRKLEHEVLYRLSQED